MKDYKFMIKKEEVYMIKDGKVYMECLEGSANWALAQMMAVLRETANYAVSMYERDFERFASE